jgi:hypothetical protein
MIGKTVSQKLGSQPSHKIFLEGSLSNHFIFLLFIFGVLKGIFSFENLKFLIIYNFSHKFSKEILEVQAFKREHYPFK